MKRLAIIPARGGSKRIPRKNIRPFCGVPIIKYSIDAAIQSQCFDEIMVSTDDKEIACIAEKYGAKIPFLRSAATANDYATTADVLVEVINNYSKIGINFDYVCCIYPTAPFVTPEIINDSYNKIIQNKAKSAFPVVKFEYSIYRGLRKNKDDKLEMLWPKNISVRSQDLEEAFHDAGQFYWLKVDSLMKEKIVFSDQSIGIEVSCLNVQDIDNENDWKLAEIKYKHFKNLEF